MEEKQLKKLLKEQTQEVKSYVDGRLSKQTKNLREDYNRQGKFLLDEFKHQASIVAEQYTGLNKKVDSMGNKLDATFEEVGNLKVNVEIIKQDVEFIKSSLKRKVDMEEFEALEKRVILLERKFQST